LNRNRSDDSFVRSSRIDSDPLDLFHPGIFALISALRRPAAILDRLMERLRLSFTPISFQQNNPKEKTAKLARF
jgi:hypothetical protein